MSTVNLRKRITFLLASLVVLASLPAAVLAQGVIQGYNSDQPLQKGMLVIVSSTDPSKVEAITDKNLSNLKGVVVDASDSPVRVSGEGQNVFVASGGKYEVLVSNENGPIKSGDYLSGSSLGGIAMKADGSQSLVVGRAAANFQGGGDSIGKSVAKDGKVVEFGRIAVDIGIGKNPLVKAPEKDVVVDTLKNVASTVADKQVSPLRIYLSILLLLIVSSVTALMLISGVRSAVISLGRNPLSRNIILKGMLQVLLLSVTIFITGLFGVYLLIKL